MPDTVHHVMWYTVYDAKTGDLLASGTSDMCARRLGYKSANSFASSVYHCRKKKRKQSFHVKSSISPPVVSGDPYFCGFESIGIIGF